MAAFSALTAQVDQACLNVFGEVAATLNPRDQSASVPFRGIIRNPALEEDFVPGSTPNVGVIRLFVNLTLLSRAPVKGDRVTIAGAVYDIFDMPVDTEGGCVLKLRRE